MSNMITRRESMSLQETTNNESIISKASTFFHKCILKLKDDTSFSPGDLIDFTKRIETLIKGRLEIGAESYGEEVPITAEDISSWEERHKKLRDNLSEGVEEILDAIVYTIADYLKPAPSLNSREEKENYLIYKKEVRKALGHLIYSAYYLFSAMKKRSV